jgi:hypothetical protein
MTTLMTDVNVLIVDLQTFVTPPLNFEGTYRGMYLGQKVVRSFTNSML